MSITDKNKNKLLEKNEDSTITDKQLMSFNPDILVNRFNLVIRLIKTADTIEKAELRNMLITSAALVIESVRQGLDLIEEGIDENEIYH